MPQDLYPNMIQEDKSRKLLNAKTPIQSSSNERFGQILPKIIGDERRLRQVLMNLVKNYH